MLAMLLATLLLPSTKATADLLHNSVDTGSGSSKWPNGWGIAGGKYGQFVCATCHEPDADNLKNIRRTINTMDGSNWPNGSSSSTVYFLNQTSMGDDRKKHNKSNRICEVCHSRNDFHNYSSGNNITMGHPLNVPPPIVCVSCHKHNTGFKAACGNCHGNPPVTAVLGTFSSMVSNPRPSNTLTPGRAGAHRTHVYTRNMVCETCHYVNNGGITMPNQSATIQIGFFGFGGKVTDGTFTPYTSATRGYRFASGTANTIVAPASTSYATANQCANVYCHGGGSTTNGKPPLTGGADPIPNWDGVNQNACGSCHGTTAANPPTMGSHAKHAGSATGYSYACDTCHPAIDISHVQGSVRWEMNTSDPKVGAGATYRGLATGFTNDLAPSATYGQCSNISCHSDGKGGAANVASPTWGQALPAACSGCHGGTSGASVIVTAAHGAHVNNVRTNYTCARCHANTADAGGAAALNPTTGLQYHVNSTKDVNFDTFNASANYATQGCANVYCHSKGLTANAPFAVLSTARWGGTLPTNCTACHGGAGATSGRFRVMSTGRHQKHMRGTSFAAANLYYSYACSDCHNSTASGSSEIGNPANHVNYKVDVAFPTTLGGSATYPSTGHAPGVDTTRTCANVYCHSNAQTGGQPGTALIFRNLTGSKTWYGTATSLGCSGCHSSANTTGALALSGKHGVHASATINPSIGTGLACAECHLKTRLTSGWNDRNKHNNRFIDYSGLKAGGQVNLNTATGICANVYCHSDGKGTFKAMSSSGWFSARTLDCRGCHGSDEAAAFASVAGEPNYANSGLTRANSHQAHTTKLTLTGAASCDYCHFNTVVTAGTGIKAGTSHLDRTLSVDFNTAKATATWNSVSKTCSNISCHSGGSSTWGDVASAGCNTCHGALSASHGVHIGDLMTSGAASFYNFTATRSVGTVYRIGCANCHPTDVAKHRNGTVDLSINKNKVGASSLTALNSLATADGINVANSGITGTSGTNVVCSASYCHSNGRIIPLLAGDYKDSPNWYAAPVTTNRCGMCHDNPPQYAGQSHYVAASSLGINGTPPYKDSGHMISIHFKNTSKGNNQNGFLGYSSAGSKAHGNPAVATTISCYICHSGIVSTTTIDTYAMNGTSSKFRCGSCHTAGTPTPLQNGQIVNTALHVNGAKNIAFAPITYKTKAQLSNQSNAIGWSRNGAYKAAASYDSADLSISTWVPATKTCLTACHVNQPNITWGAALQCLSCHANQ